jgi:REP element-mobilizing transposase RayT
MSTPPITKGRSSELRKGRLSEDFASYAITKVVEGRHRVLAIVAAAGILMDSWQYLRGANRIKAFAFCIMPDHFHLVFCLLPVNDLSTVMEDSSKFTSPQLNKLLSRHGRFWQNGFHDHRCRNEKELYDLCLYIEHNPVRKRLVATAEDWPYSSAFTANKWMLYREWWP